MVNVPSMEKRKQAYVDAIGGVPGAYKAGVESTNNWKESALAGQSLYERRMQDQDVLRRRERGLQKVSDQDWKARASALGSVRIADGMRNGADKQARNYEPIAVALRGLQLPERSADPMANIDNRVKAVVRTAIAASPKNQ